MKKVLAVLLAIMMMLTLSSVSFAAENSKNGNLQFDENDKFEIMLVADAQDGFPIEDDFKNAFNQALDKAQPDLVIFLGDIVMSAETDEEYWAGYGDLLNPLVDRDIPFTLVFGNHDDQDAHKGSTKDEKLAKYMSFENCLAYDADPALHGSGTHNLEILSSDGTKTAYNLWMMDSGDYIEGGYDCVRADQLEWYEGVSKQLEADNGVKVPSLMFQHIVPAEVAKEVMFTVKGDLGALGSTNFSDGTAATYLPNIWGFEEGWMFEQACPSPDCEGQWDAITERGDVQAVFFGHDHINTYVANINGIDAVNVPGSTYNSYYDMLAQGFMVVSLDENDLSTYKRTMLYTSDLALEEGSKLPDGNHGKAYYQFANIFRPVMNFIVKAMRVILFPFSFFAK
ncbi:MAG: metallophosphoesterase [Clostridia bacterium]|nr:metallophosphoesterase [Clostridia bacterium]